MNQSRSSARLNLARARDGEVINAGRMIAIAVEECTVVVDIERGRLAAEHRQRVVVD